MDDITDNQVISAIYTLPDPQQHVAHPPAGVHLPKKTVTMADLTPAPALWHEGKGHKPLIKPRAFQYNPNGQNNHKNPPGSISGPQLLEAARRLVLNSLQVGPGGCQPSGPDPINVLPRPQDHGANNYQSSGSQIVNTPCGSQGPSSLRRVNGIWVHEQKHQSSGSQIGPSNPPHGLLNQHQPDGFRNGLVNTPHGSQDPQPDSKHDKSDPQPVRCSVRRVNGIWVCEPNQHQSSGLNQNGPSNSPHGLNQHQPCGFRNGLGNSPHGRNHRPGGRWRGPGKHRHGQKQHQLGGNQNGPVNSPHGSQGPTKVLGGNLTGPVNPPHGSQGPTKVPGGTQPHQGGASNSGGNSSGGKKKNRNKPGGNQDVPVNQPCGSQGPTKVPCFTQPQQGGGSNKEGKSSGGKNHNQVDGPRKGPVNPPQGPTKMPGVTQPHQGGGSNSGGSTSGGMNEAVNPQHMSQEITKVSGGTQPQQGGGSNSGSNFSGGMNHNQPQGGVWVPVANQSGTPGNTHPNKKKRRQKKKQAAVEQNPIS